MGKIVISEGVSLDGVAQDPTGDEGFSRGGWFLGVGDKDNKYRAWAKVEFEEAMRCWAGAATSGSPRGGHPGLASSRTG